jgi:hypothetical protein
MIARSTGAAPRQRERRMDVQPIGLLEQLARDQRPVVDEDDDVDAEVEPRGPLRLPDRDVEPTRHLLRRRSRRPAAAPLRAVRAGQDVLDLLPRGELGQDVRAELPRRRDGDAH